MPSGTKKKGDSGDDPPGWLLLGLEVERPDERGSAGPSLVNRTLVDVLCLLLVHRDGSDENDGHGGR